MRELKNVDPRIVTAFPGGDDNTLTLRLLIKKGNAELAFSLFSDKKNYIARDIITLATYFIIENDEKNFIDFLKHATTKQLYQELS